MITAHHNSCDHGGGDGSSCSCENCGSGNGCDCEIKTIDALHDNEIDPTFTEWRDGTFADWKQWVDENINQMAHEVVAIKEFVGKIPISPRYPGTTPGLSE